MDGRVIRFTTTGSYRSVTGASLMFSDGERHDFDFDADVDPHGQNPEDEDLCVCGGAGLWETPDRWVCYRTADRAPSPPPSLTRGGFMTS